MRATWLLGIVLLASGCPSNDLLLPNEAPRRQLSLAERILERAIRPDADPAVQADVALALSEVAVPGQIPQLRIVVSNDHPVLCRAAAQALVRIRIARAPPQRASILQECVKTETNQYVKDRCASELLPKAPEPAKPELAPIVSRIEADDVEVRRSGLRQLLAAPGLATRADDRLESALYHRLQDPDARVRLLTSAVFLRRSLATDPLATDFASR
jgi:hypothetical protein